MTSRAPPSMAPPSPRVRGQYMKNFVGQIDRLPAADRDRIRAALPEVTWASIEASGFATWLPLETNLQVTRAVADCLGPRRTQEFFHALLGSTFEGPLLRRLVQAVLRTLGNDPAVILPWVSKGFGILFKDCGEWSVDDREAWAASLTVRRLPRAAIEDRVWLEAVASSLAAVFIVAKVQGVATIRDVDPARGTVVFRARWEP